MTGDPEAESGTTLVDRGRRLAAFVVGFLRGYTWSHHLDMGAASDDRE